MDLTDTASSLKILQVGEIVQPELFNFNFDCFESCFGYILGAVMQSHELDFNSGNESLFYAIKI